MSRFTFVFLFAACGWVIGGANAGADLEERADDSFERPHEDVLILSHQPRREEVGQ